MNNLDIRVFSISEDYDVSGFFYAETSQICKALYCDIFAFAQANLSQILRTSFSDPFTARICAYILMLPSFCSYAFTAMQKFVHLA